MNERDRLEYKAAKMNDQEPHSVTLSADRLLWGLLPKDLGSYHYMDYGTYDSAENVLGMNDPVWKDKKHLVFRTASGDYSLRLK